MRLKDNTALITGGASGIGFALAKALRDEGNEVIICGRDKHKLDAAANALPGLYVVPCDITDRRQVEHMRRFLEDNFPKLNMLFNNAGIQNRCDLLDGIRRWDPIFDEINTNLTAQILLTEQMLPLLIQQPEAAVVNITSALAVAPKKSAPIYCAAKAGLRNFSRSLRYQLAETSVRVFEVVPDLVDTPMTSDRGDPNKISAEAAASETLAGLRKDRHEISMKRAGRLLWVHRLWPELAYRLTKDL